MQQAELTEIFMLNSNQIILKLWREMVQGRAYPGLLCLPRSTLTSVVSRRQHSSSEHLESHSTTQQAPLFLQGWDSVPENPSLLSLYCSTSIVPAAGCADSLYPSACEGLDSSIPQGIPPQLRCSAPHWQGAAGTSQLC